MRDRTRVGVITRYALELAAEIDAPLQDIVHPLEIQRIADGHASRQLQGDAGDRDRGGDRDGTGSQRTDQRRVVDQDRALVDVELTGPTGVARVDDERTEVVLREARGRTGAGVQVERGVELQRGALGDLDGAGIGGAGQTDHRATGEAGRGTEGRGPGGRRERDGRSAERADGGHGKYALLDDDRGADHVAGAGKDQGTRTALGETGGGGKIAGEFQALGDVRARGRQDVIRGAGRDRDVPGIPESVAVVVAEDESACDVRDGSDRDLLVRRSGERKGAAGTSHGKRRDDARVEDDGARQDDRLRSRRSVAIMQEGDRVRIAERRGVEVTRVALGVEGQGAGAGDVETGDVRDIGYLAQQGHGKIRALDRDGRRAGFEPGHRSVQGERPLGGSGVAESRRAGPGQDVTDGAVSVVDQQAGAGRHGDGTGSERPGETCASLGDGGHAADDDAAAADRQAVEVIDPGELQQAIAGLDDAGARAGDGRTDRQGRMDVRVGHRRAGDHDRRDGEGVGAGGQDQRAAGDDLRVGGAAGRSRDRAGGRERETGAGA